MGTIHHLPLAAENQIATECNGAPTDQRALPATQVIRLPLSSDSPDLRFERAYHAAKIAHAEYRLNEARRFAHVQLAGPDHWRTNPYNGEGPFNLMRATMFKIAVTPATTRGQMCRKKHLIGDVWLKAEGEFYDALRAGVEIDELRFVKKRRVRDHG